MGRTAGGVRGIEVDEAISHRAEVVQEGVSVFTITERGYGKRTRSRNTASRVARARHHRHQDRGRNVPWSDAPDPRERRHPRGHDQGKMIRIHGVNITSQGVIPWSAVIDLDADDRVGSIARVEAEQRSRPRHSATRGGQEPPAGALCFCRARTGDCGRAES